MGLCASSSPVDPKSIPPEAVVWSAGDPQPDLTASTASLADPRAKSAAGSTASIGGTETLTQPTKQHSGYATVQSGEPSPAAQSVKKAAAAAEAVPTEAQDVKVELQDVDAMEVEVRMVDQDGGETPLGHVEVEQQETVLRVRQKIMYELDRVPERFLFIDKYDVPLDVAAEYTTTLKDHMMGDGHVLKLMKSPEPPVAPDTPDEPGHEQSYKSEDWDQELAQEEAELRELEALEAAEREEEERRAKDKQRTPRSARKKKKSIGFTDYDVYEPDPPPPPPEYIEPVRKEFKKPKILPVTVRPREDEVPVLEHVLAGGWQSLESVSHAGHFVRFQRVKNFYCQISAYSRRLEVEDATFRAVPGLNWTQNCVSFESLNHPGFFLKHTGANQPIKIEEEREGRQWRKDASWRVLEGLNGDPDAITLESVSKMGHAVSLKQFNLYLRKIERTSVFAKGASFRCCLPLYAGDLPDEDKTSLEEATDPEADLDTV